MSEPGPEPMLPYGPPEPAQPTQPYQQPTFEQPSWETPGPPYTPLPAPLPYAAPVYGQPDAPPYAVLPTGYPGYLVDQPSATTALILGIVSLAGTLLCGIFVVLGPFAWVVGAKSRRAIRAHPELYTGQSKATAGMVMGIISTVLLVIGVAFIALFVVLIATGNTDSGTTP